MSHFRLDRMSDEEKEVDEESEEDEEDSFIAAKISQDKARHSAASNGDGQMSDNLGISLNRSELVLSEDEDEEAMQEKDAWLVDRNSWDDEDDVAEIEGKVESKTTGDQEKGTVVDMETWDSDSDSDESGC